MTATASTTEAGNSPHLLDPAYQILRLGAAFCFIGHGAFGLITKAAWLPYFAVAGIPEAWAWRIMPWIGAADVAAGLAVLLAPRRLPLLYMVMWALWTALLRPFAGEPVFEALERAGNYGVPLAFLLFAGWPRPLSRRSLVTPLGPPLRDACTLIRVRAVLRWTTFLLLFGHGALGAITGKAMLTAHYAAIGLPALTTPLIGVAEMGLALAVAARPAVGLLLFVTLWKTASESLFLIAGDSIWEFVERTGSYTAPLALAILLASPRVTRRDATGADGSGRRGRRGVVFPLSGFSARASRVFSAFGG